MKIISHLGIFRDVKFRSTNSTKVLSMSCWCQNKKWSWHVHVSSKIL